MAAEEQPHEPSRLGFREIFEMRKINNNPLRAHPTHRDGGLPGLITCTMPFVLENGRSFAAIGCSEGIWVADSHDPDFMHRVMDLKGVTVFFVIEQYHILLVLADKALYCYSLDALDPYSNAVRVPQKLSGTAAVDFFRVGIWETSLMVVYKKKRVTDSVFIVLEPELGPSPGDGRTCHFRFHKEFYLPVDCTDLVFLKSTLAILHPQGFEVLDLNTLSTVTIPHSMDKALAKRCKATRPLGLFRGRGGRHLLCYTTFGLLVDRHGAPLHDLAPVIEWHGTVYAVAPAAPYIVLFKARSVEVRRGDSGVLEQVVFGSGVRCAWRGPGVLQGELGEDDLVPEEAHTRSRVQVVMEAPHGRGEGEIAQHVYDFVLKAT